MHFFFQGYLDKLQSEISKTLEKISSREKYVNNQVGLSFYFVYCLGMLNNIRALLYKHPANIIKGFWPRARSVL